MKLGAKHAALGDGAHTATQIEHRPAAPAQPGDLLGVAGGAGRRPSSGAIGELLNDESAQRAWELGQALEGDCIDRGAARPVELTSDEGVENLGLLAQHGGRAQHVGRGSRMNLGERRGQAVANPVAGVGQFIVA